MEVTQDLTERTQRWRQIEEFCGFTILNPVRDCSKMTSFMQVLILLTSLVTLISTFQGVSHVVTKYLIRSSPSKSVASFMDDHK